MPLNTKSVTVIILFAWAAASALVTSHVHARSGSELFLIDFESLAEQTQISTQYSSLGATFSIVGDPTAFPIVALEGSPAVGFNGPTADTPMSSGSGGLTDPMVGGDPFTWGGDIAIDFSPAVTSVRFFIIDIDGNNSFTAFAYDGATEVDSMTKSSGQAGTGEGASTEFFLSAANSTSVVIDAPTGTTTGYAIDYLTFTRPCKGAACGQQIEVSQESAPGLGDFDGNILGFILAHATTASALGFYAYDVPEGTSWNGQSLTPIADRSHLLMAGTSDGMSLVIVHDRAIPDDPDGGRAEMMCEVFGDPDGASRTVEDDPDSIEPGGGYTGNPGDSLFTSAHSWNTCCTDGLVLSGLDGEWSMIVQFTEVDGNGATVPIVGLSEWVAYSADGSTIPLTLETDRRVRILMVTSCPGDLNGDGVVNSADLTILLGAWAAGTATGDIDGDGDTDSADLTLLLGAWASGGCA